MMADMIMVPLTDVKEAARKLLSAHDAVREGIATHAQKHTEALDARRKEAATRRRMEEGIARQNAKV